MKTVIICILAGLGAGLSTGFAGLSAAVFISPMLVTFLDIPVYSAVGISLASDVLASAVSAVTYKTHGNINIKDSRWLLVSVLSFTVIGSAAAYFITTGETGDTIFGYWSVIASFALGIWFLLQKDKGDNIADGGKFSEKRTLVSILIGAVIGFICGFQGAGGGMMLLFALTAVMAFEFKTAVGTSVLIMTFTALIGAVSHFAVKGLPDLKILLICVLATTVFARIGAVIANKVSRITLKRITGALLTVSGGIMLYVKAAGL